ncbi:transcription cofactor vestigial-like protein 1 [Anolis carolinensis]|uniref:transcription cofactor vestigial-like protein 1 n=1 Tax=Anolis carolinensis TaxID=28377 RepID=UPI002F2B460F
MEDRKENDAKLSKSKQPVKTEWGAQYVVFTYFQGDINSVVDEHFSRALSSTKIPQDLSRKGNGGGGGDVMVKTESHLPQAQQWSYSPQWAKPYPGPLPPLSESPSALASADPFPSPVLRAGPPPAMELWPVPSGGTPAPGYPPSVPLAHEAKYEGSLLGLLHQQDRGPSSVQEPTESRPTCLSGSARLQNISQGLTAAGGLPANDRRRDLFF